MILEWNNLHWVDSHIKHPKNSNHLQSHSRAIVALDHNRLDLENKFLANKSGQSFCFRQVYFTKSCQQIRGCVNQPFILFIHHIWGETVLFIIQTSDRMQYFTIFQDKYCTQSIFRTINCGLLAKPFKKFPKSPIRPASSHLWWAPNLQWTLIELRFNIINNLLCLFFNIRVL